MSTYEGCWNTQRQPRYQVHVREYAPDGSWLLKREWIEDRGSTDCRYDKKTEDQRCEGCRK